MSDAPERIWADVTSHSQWFAQYDEPTGQHTMTEYVRADRIEELEAERERDRKALRDALRRAEKSEIAAANYASFNHEWRQRAEKAEAESKRLREALRKCGLINGWTGEPHVSNMEYGPNVASEVQRIARAALQENTPNES